MDLTDSRKIYNERVEEITEFLDFVKKIDPVAIPELDFSPRQQRVLFSTVYLMLYNLVESTVNKYTQAIVEEIVKQDRWTLLHLSDEIVNEWTRSNAKNHSGKNYENRLRDTANIIREALVGNSIKFFKIEKGGGGNWDDEAIYKFFTSRIGLKVDISTEVNKNVKRHVLGDKGIMKVIVLRRNDLAHGDLSFSDCGADITSGDLKDYSERVFNYLGALIECFEDYMLKYEYLKPEYRPTI